MSEEIVSIEATPPGDLPARVVRAQQQGAQFAALQARQEQRTTVLEVLLDFGGGWHLLEARLAPGERHYPSLTPAVPAAAWYERAAHDLAGVVPDGHPSLEPLLVPDDAPQPDRSGQTRGEGVTTVPYGPVRSGVFETIEVDFETVGEDILGVWVRPFYKRRGVAERLVQVPLDQAVLVAERIEGQVSVAHALAFAAACERLADLRAPWPAEMVRVLHAELERVANHLDSMVRHCEGAGQAVALARLATHKERVQRLRARLCGHRFGRGVVVPGGVQGPPLLPVADALAELRRIERPLLDDLGLLMRTPSFLDRLRGTGVLPADLVARHAALGPIGRASGRRQDTRQTHPSAGYAVLGVQVAGAEAGDALARQEVRVEEILESFRLARLALEAFQQQTGPRGATDPAAWRDPRVLGPGDLELGDGCAVGAVEAPQGQLVHLLRAEGGRLVHAGVHTPSFHNMALYPQAYGGDIFTDVVFIEASFGLSAAGVAG